MKQSLLAKGKEESPQIVVVVASAAAVSMADNEILGVRGK